MSHGKNRAGHDRHSLLSIVGSVMVVWGAAVGSNREINLAHILIALAFGLGLMLVWLRTADFGSQLVSVFIGSSACWLIGYAVGMSVHWQLIPLTS